MSKSVRLSERGAAREEGLPQAHDVVYQSSAFSRLARLTSHGAGHPAAFLTAVAIIILWGILGPIYHYSDTWQLVINTGTTIITFLMVFLIQNTQNRDSAAMHLKLDEIIRATEGAHNAMLDLEELTEEELALMRRRYLDMARAARSELRSGRQDTGCPPD